MIRNVLCENLRNLWMALSILLPLVGLHAQTFQPSAAPSLQSTPAPNASLAPGEEETIVPTFETQKLARTYILDIPAPRGQITDRNGVPLAQNKLSYNLGFNFPTPLDFSDAQAIAFAREKIERIARHNDPDIAGYRIRRRDYFQNTWLRHAQISPWYIRLVRPELARYSREINEVLEIAGTVGELASPLDHYPFSKGISHWLQRHDVYSTMEARLIAEGGGLSHPSLKKAL
ncbi:MAG: hypothetical protein QOI22_608, partial [Verrucomicrobiota bacterium]